MPLAGENLDRPLLTGSLLNTGLDNGPCAEALVSLTAARSWREVDQSSSRLGASYLKLGLRKGDRVASLMPNRASLLIHYLACLKAGLVSTPLNYRYTATEIDHALQVSDASLLLAHAERAGDLTGSKAVERLPLGLVSFDDDANGRIGEEPILDELLDDSCPEGKFEQHPSDAPAVIFFTSGSTGKPKGVTHSHGSLGWLLASMVQSYRMTARDVLMPATSMTHLGGYTFSLAGLAAGARIDIVRDINDGELLRLLRQTRPTALKILPAALSALVRDPEATPDDFASLRLCIAGGDKVSGELEKSFKSLSGLEVTEIYGMTETGSTTFNPFGPDHKNGSIGKPGAGYSVSIRDDQGSEVPTGREGRLWIGFPGIFVGYWNNPEATRQSIVDGWVDSGDIVSADSDGCLWFHGRQKQIIVHDGSNICPQEVEEAVVAHPAVALACAVGIRHPVHGENVRAYVTLNAGADRPPDSEIIAQARRAVGYKAPEEIVILDEMPIMASGKIDRNRLKRMAAEEAVA